MSKRWTYEHDANGKRQANENGGIVLQVDNGSIETALKIIVQRSTIRWRMKTV